MRFVFATLIVIACLTVIAGVIGLTDDIARLSPYHRALLRALGPVVTFALIMVSIVVIRRLFPGKTAEEHERYLVENGLLVEEHYTATRAFNVEEFEDEGSIYFVELTDGRVLFLMGQYLYEYEPIDDGPDNSQPRTFPCTEFTLRRHRDKGYVYDIKCGGEVVEPEVTAAWLGKDVWKKGVLPEDGEIITGRTYDDLKREHMGRRR